MRRQLTLTCDPIEVTRMTSSRAPDRGVGAIVTFIGTVRGEESGGEIAALEYTAFEAMVEHQFGQLFEALEARWPIHSVQVVHRLGRVAATEPSLWVQITAPHRGEAFAACQWLIDEMKRLVPIWKKPLA